MANRTFARDQYANVKDPVTLYVAVAFNATSAPSLLKCDPTTGIYTVAPSAGDGYALSFTRTSIGLYVLTLLDGYVRVLSVVPTWISNTNPAAPIVAVKVASDPTNAQSFGTALGSGNIRGTNRTVTLNINSAAATLADPAATEMAVLAITLQLSSSR